MSLESFQKKYDKILNEAKDITSPIIDRLSGNPSPEEAEGKLLTMASYTGHVAFQSVCLNSTPFSLIRPRRSKRK